MLLRKVVLQNFCQHEKLTVKLQPGLTAIVGRNGSGKTNLIQGVQASLTNDFRWGSGKKGKVYRQAAAKEKSFVKAYWEHHGVKFSVCRGLRGLKDKLEIQDAAEAKTVIGEKPIRQELEKILGVSLRLVGEYLFVDQGHVADFLFKSGKERAQSFAALCKAERAEQLWKSLGDAISVDSRLLESFGEVEISEDALHQEMAELSREHKKTVAEVAEIEAKRLTREQRLAKRRVLKKAARRKSLLVRRRKFERMVDSINAKLQQAEKESEAAEAAVVTLEQKYKAVDLAEANRKLGQLQAAQEEFARYCKAKQALAELREPAEPAKPVYYTNHELLEEAEKKLQQDREELRFERRRWEGLQNGKCVTCGQPVKGTEGYSQEYFTDKEQRLKKDQKRLDGWRKYESDLRDYQADKKYHESLRANLERQISECRVKKSPEGDQDAAKRAVQEAKDIDEELRKARRSLTSKQECYVRTKSEYKQAVQRLKEVNKQLRKLPKSNAHETARHALERDNERRQKVQQLQQEEARLAAELKRVDWQLQQLEARKKKTKKLRRWVKDMKAWRDQVHHTAIPADLIGAALQLLKVEVNKNLEAFRAPFYVEIAEDLSFLVQHDKGDSEPASMLSGGQKVLLAMATYLAVSYLFTEDLGMLVLDEPTAFLDSQNVESVAEVLKGISRVTREQRRQIIMITHDDRLSGVFDSVISLG
jgi:DNA repair exonuclease SbcCD ATPase subunit